MSTSITPLLPQVQTLTQACQTVAMEWALEHAEATVQARLAQGIRDDNDLRATDELLHQVVLGADALETAVKPPIAEAHALHKLLCGVADPWRKRWSGMVDNLKRAISGYKTEQARLAHQRQEEEQRRADEERRRKEEEARAALRSGDMATARQVRQEAEAIVTPLVPVATPILSHSTDREPWQVEVTDALALVKAVASGLLPLCTVKEFDITFLKKEARQRGGLPLEWGVRAWQEKAISVRRR